MTETLDDDPADEREESRSARTADVNEGGGLGDDRSLTEYVQLGLVGILLLLTAVATFQFYTAAGTAVDRFVTQQYRPLFQAAFNLAILLAAGVGLSMLLRRLS